MQYLFFIFSAMAFVISSVLLFVRRRNSPVLFNKIKVNRVVKLTTFDFPIGIFKSQNYELISMENYTFTLKFKGENWLEVQFLVDNSKICTKQEIGQKGCIYGVLDKMHSTKLCVKQQNSAILCNMHNTIKILIKKSNIPFKVGTNKNIIKFDDFKFELQSDGKIGFNIFDDYLEYEVTKANSVILDYSSLELQPLSRNEIKQIAFQNFGLPQLNFERPDFSQLYKSGLKGDYARQCVQNVRFVITRQLSETNINLTEQYNKSNIDLIKQPTKNTINPSKQLTKNIVNPTEKSNQKVINSTERPMNSTLNTIMGKILNSTEQPTGHTINLTKKTTENTINLTKLGFSKWTTLRKWGSLLVLEDWLTNYSIKIYTTSQMHYLCCWWGEVFLCLDSEDYTLRTLSFELMKEGKINLFKYNFNWQFFPLKMQFDFAYAMLKYMNKHNISKWLANENIASFILECLPKNLEINEAHYSFVRELYPYIILKPLKQDLLLFMQKYEQMFYKSI